ncbi:hypothetical protein APHAL10511_007225 [Amanita phalloides]|nr:hypothetical protein APHAL10511_007225 [Amanita phalloides]
MSTTTQILFNSPALHSLKREQLIKLCKIHSIKATGKNAELIEKLKQHALTLPRDSPLSIAARSENAPFQSHMNDASEQADRQWRPYDHARPSEQWEVVMDNIEEMEEPSSAQGSLNSLRTVGKDQSAGEFGTVGSMSSVGSSLRAFATSLGLKRAGACPNTTSPRSPPLKPNLSSNTINHELEATRGLAQSSCSQPPPATSTLAIHVDNSASATDVDMEVPVPGQALRPGIPAPLNARLSLGLGQQTPSKGPQPTTTIRLISGHPCIDAAESASPTSSTPQLIPFKTTFDLIMSPSLAFGIKFGTSNTTWSSECANVYPTLSSEVGQTLSHLEDPETGCTMDGIIYSDGDLNMPGAFSSPCPPITTNVTNDTPMSPPSELPSGNVGLPSNALMPTPEPFVFGSPLPRHRVSDAQFREAASNVLDEMNKRLQAEGVNPVDLNIIKRLHPEANVGTRQGIEDVFSCATHSDGIKKMFERRHQAEFSKMEGIDALVKRRAMTGTKADNHVQESIVVGKKRKSNVLIEEPRRPPGQIAARASGTRVISNGRRSKMIPEPLNDELLHQDADADEERGKKKAKRSEGRADVHTAERKKKNREREAVRRKLEANKARRSSVATERASIGRVQQKQKPSRFGFLAQAKSIVQSVFRRSKPATTGAPVTAVSAASSRTKTGKPQGPEEMLKDSSKATITQQETTRSVIGNNSNVTSLGNRNFTGARSKKSSTPASIPRNNSASLSDVGSMGYKASSMGIRGFAAKRPTISSLGAKISERERVPSSLRLHAPTASSLAKINSRTPTTTLRSKESSSDNKQPSVISTLNRKQNALTSITNNLSHDSISTSKPMSRPMTGGIFGESPNPACLSPGGLAATDNDVKMSTKPAQVPEVQPSLQRQRTLSGRKPRISRSKVISRLASQRAVSVKNDGAPNIGTRRASATGKPISSNGRTRSSLGVKPIGKSGHVELRVGSGGNGLLMSAKKRARQSEYYARRRSRAEVAKQN